MMPQECPQAPDFLTQETTTLRWGKIENQEKWGLQYQAKLNHPNKKNDFQWATYQGKRVNSLLAPLLRKITNNHCSFCDIFPLQQSGGTIEHFRPKKQFPLLSHVWENLFYCCHRCQEKGERFDGTLLKADEIDYQFDTFFICRTNNKRIFIQANPRANTTNQERAQTTIDLYGLNKFERPEARWLTLVQFQDCNNPIVEDFSYRFLFL